MAIAPELIAGAPEMFADPSVGKLVAGAGLDKKGVARLMQTSRGPDHFLQQLKALQPAPARRPAAGAPGSGSPASRDAQRSPARRPLPSPGPRSGGGPSRLPASTGQANAMIFKLLVAGGLGLLVMELASTVTGQYFQFDYKAVPSKARAVFDASAQDPGNQAPDRYAYRDLYAKAPPGAGQHPSALNGPATQPPGTFLA